MISKINSGMESYAIRCTALRMVRSFLVLDRVRHNSFKQMDCVNTAQWRTILTTITGGYPYVEGVGISDYIHNGRYGGWEIVS